MALHLVKMACERPDDRGRSLSFWDCREMARQLVAEGVVPGISPDTVRRLALQNALDARRPVESSVRRFEVRDHDGRLEIGERPDGPIHLPGIPPDCVRRRLEHLP